MRSLIPAVVLSVAALVAPAPARAADDASGAVVVSAQFRSRTSLRVSRELLEFDVMAPGHVSTAVVTFAAGARTPSGAEVVLSLEPSRGIDGPGGAADVEASLSFAGEGDGTLAGPVKGGTPTVAGRWIGSGFRNGRLVFSLRAGAAGRYAIPLNFVLSAP